MVGSSVTEASLNILNHGGDLSNINQILIALIPKVKSSTQVIEFKQSLYYFV